MDKYCSTDPRVGLILTKHKGEKLIVNVVPYVQ